MEMDYQQNCYSHTLKIVLYFDTYELLSQKTIKSHKVKLNNMTTVKLCHHLPCRSKRELASVAVSDGACVIGVKYDL